MFTNDFIEKIGKINTKYAKKYRKRYFAFTEEFKTECEYNDKLEGYLNQFRSELLNLPFNLDSLQSRKMYLNNLHDQFLITQKGLNNQFREVLTTSFECISKQRGSFSFYFPRYFQKKYLAEARDAYQKICIAYTLQNDKIENAIEILTSTALNDGIELNTFYEESGERIRTTLSSQELAFLSFIIVQKIAEDKNFNRTLLSRIIANNFSSKKADAPISNQIRKRFTGANDNVKKNVVKILAEISATLISEYS